jgi:hypothetical protein
MLGACNDTSPSQHKPGDDPHTRLTAKSTHPAEPPARFAVPVTRTTSLTWSNLRRMSKNVSVTCLEDRRNLPHGLPLALGAGPKGSDLAAACGQLPVPRYLEERTALSRHASCPDMWNPNDPG